MRLQLAMPIVACFLVLSVAAGHASPRDDLAAAARAFDEAALRNNDDSGQPTGVRKWMGPIKVAARNPGQGSGLVQPTVDAIRAIAAIAKVEVNGVDAADSQANFFLYFDENESVSGRRSCQASLRSTTWPTQRVEIKINPSAGAHVDRCIIHEAMHAFGFWSHPHGGDSVLSYVYRRPKLTELDVNLIKTLYDPALKPGTGPLAASIHGCRTLAKLMSSSDADRDHVCDAKRRAQRSANGEDFALAAPVLATTAGPANPCGTRVNYWVNVYDGKIAIYFSGGWRTFTADANGNVASSFTVQTGDNRFDFKIDGNLKSRMLEVQNVTRGCTWEGRLS